MSIKNTFPRAHLFVEGPDDLSFLHSLLTQSVTDLDASQIRYGLLLTPQGRLFSDLFIQAKDKGILLSLPPSRGEAVLKQLSLYKLRQKVALSISPGFISFDLAPFIGSCPDPRIPELHLSLSSLSSHSAFDYQVWRLQHSIPEGDDFIWEKSIPLEFQLDQLNAIDWQKGCYPGQELTARTHYQGMVRKGLLYGQAFIPCEIGQDLFWEEKKIGEIRARAGNHVLAQVRLHDFPEWPVILKDEGGREILKALSKRGPLDPS